jgi:hypothetical protein
MGAAPSVASATSECLKKARLVACEVVGGDNVENRVQRTATIKNNLIRSHMERRISQGFIAMVVFVILKPQILLDV